MVFQIPPRWICFVLGHAPPMVEADRTAEGALRYPHRIRWVCPRCHRVLGASS